MRISGATGEAQRGLGGARLGPGEYSFDFDEVLEAIDRGEGRQALAYYERVAAQAEQEGDRARAARAFSAAAIVARRVGLLQESIRTGTRSIELFKTVELASADPRRFATAYAQVGTAYRLVGISLEPARCWRRGSRCSRPTRAAAAVASRWASCRARSPTSLTPSATIRRHWPAPARPPSSTRTWSSTSRHKRRNAAS